MMNFDKNVPFDPGYSKLSFSFIDHISYVAGSYNQLKAVHQKKFQLSKIEQPVLDLITKSSAFYLGCMLWGGFVASRFKNEPKELIGNNTEGLSPQELEAVDCGAESRFMLQYIEAFDKDCKYFLKRPAKVPPFTKEILENYIEFAKLNNNFINVDTTDKIKLPKALEHFKDLSNEQLDTLCDKIYSIIESGKIEALLEIGFYKV